MANEDSVIRIKTVVDPASIAQADATLAQFSDRQTQREQQQAQSYQSLLRERMRSEAASIQAASQGEDRLASQRERQDARRRTREARLNQDRITDIQRVVAEEEVAARRLQQTGISSSDTQNDANQGGRRGVGWSFLGGQSFRTIGSQWRAIPGGGVPETLGRLSPLADVMAELATGASTAGAGVLGLNAGLVAIGAVIGGLIARSQQLVEGLRKGMQEMAKFARQAEGMPTQDIRGRLTELGFQISRERERQMQLGTERDATRTRLQEMVGGNPYAVLGTFLPGSEAEQLRVNAAALTAEYDAQAELVRTLSAEQLQLNLALLDGSNAYAEARDELERLIELQDTTEAERNEVIQRNKATMEYLSDLLLSGTLSEEEVAVAEDFYDALHASNVELESINHTFGDFLVFQEALKTAMEEANKAGQGFRNTLEEIWNIARELAVGARESALSTQTDQLFTEQTNLGNALEAVRKATEAYDEALAEHGERLAQIEADADEKSEEAWADAAEDFAEAEQDAQKKREEQEKEHRDRIAEINRRADRDIANAIGNRDALAAYLAEQKRQDELADEAARNKDQLEQIEEAYDDQKKAIQKRLDDQLESIEKAAAKARATEQRRYADQARDLQAAIDKERSMVQLAEARLQQIRTGYQNTRVISEVNWYATLDNVANSYQSAILFRWQYFWGQMLGGMPASPAQGGTPDHGTPWGGWAGQGGMARLDRRIDQRIGMTLGGR